LVRPGSAVFARLAAPSGSADAVGAQGRNAGSHRADAALNSTRRQAGDPGNEQRAVRADRQGAVGGEEPGLVFVEGGQDSSPAPVSLPQGRIGVTEAQGQDGTRTVSPRRAGVPQTAEAILSVLGTLTLPVHYCDDTCCFPSPQEAQDVDEAYAPQTVSVDGWQATRLAWVALFPLVACCVASCTAGCSIRDGCQKHPLFHTLSEKVWHAFHALDRRTFKPTTATVAGVGGADVEREILARTLRLCDRVREYGQA